MANYKVTFTESNVTTECSDDKTILEAATEAGLDLPFACQSGVCSTCMMKVQGEVEQEEAVALSDEELEEGNVLICVAKPKSDLTVEA